VQSKCDSPVPPKLLKDFESKVVLIFLQLRLLSDFCLQTSPRAKCWEIGEAKQEVAEEARCLWTGNGASRGERKTKARGRTNVNTALKYVLSK